MMSRNPIAVTASRAAEDVVRFDGVSMRYDRGPEILSDLNFSLAPGSFHFVTGPSRAVVNRPEILLADEPTGNVDHEMAVRIFRLFVELNRLGTTVVIATHDQDLIARSGRPVLYLEDGAITARPPPGMLL